MVCTVRSIDIQNKNCISWTKQKLFSLFDEISAVKFKKLCFKMKNKTIFVCSVVLFLKCITMIHGENDFKISWSVFGGDKNKIVWLQASPSFDSVLLTWLKYHDTSPFPGNQGKIFGYHKIVVAKVRLVFFPIGKIIN